MYVFRIKKTEHEINYLQKSIYTSLIRILKQCLICLINLQLAISIKIAENYCVSR